ncbi:uncharacterized protein [Narcine bancroftii]|uniref:uncharacterized protein n=1 Tax=Narcine bancroftii TaxID=1343680 RepID=UPI0038318868
MWRSLWSVPLDFVMARPAASGPISLILRPGTRPFTGPLDPPRCGRPDRTGPPLPPESPKDEDITEPTFPADDPPPKGLAAGCTVIIKQGLADAAPLRGARRWPATARAPNPQCRLGYRHVFCGRRGETAAMRLMKRGRMTTKRSCRHLSINGTRPGKWSDAHSAWRNSAERKIIVSTFPSGCSIPSGPQADCICQGYYTVMK